MSRSASQTGLEQGNPRPQAPHSPFNRRKRLGKILRELREAKGLTATEAARILRWPPSKLTRIERREAITPKPADVGKLADLYEVGSSTREYLIGLAQDTRIQGWWLAFADAFRGPLPDLEAEASRIRMFDGPFVPGLLQTEEYARAVFEGFGYSGAELGRRVAARMYRQWILDREDPPIFSVVLDESVARKTVGSRRIMAAQLHHLCEMALQPHISIRVVLDEQGVLDAMSGSFTILGFPADPTVIYLENAVSSFVLEASGEVERYEEIYDRIKDQSLSVDQTIGFLTGMAGEFAR